MQEQRCIDAQNPRAARLLRLLLVVTAALLAAGLIAPIITLKKFVVVENTFSVLSGIIQLAREGQWFLFVIIAGFSVVLPILKIAVLYRLVSRKRLCDARMHRYLHWMHLYGKWSMLDVFVVAILVALVQLGDLLVIRPGGAALAFAGVVMVTILAAESFDPRLMWDKVECNNE